MLLFGVFCAFVLAVAAARDEIFIREHLEDLDAQYQPLLEDCLQQNSLKLADLKTFHLNDEEIPENQLCFYLCFYTKVGFYAEDGAVNVTTIANVIEKSNDITPENQEKIVECLQTIDKVTECADVKKIEICYAQFV